MHARENGEVVPRSFENPISEAITLIALVAQTGGDDAVNAVLAAAMQHIYVRSETILDAGIEVSEIKLAVEKGIRSLPVTPGDAQH